MRPTGGPRQSELKPMEAICPSEFAMMHTLLKSAKAWLKTNGGGQWIKVGKDPKVVKKGVFRENIGKYHF